MVLRLVFLPPERSFPVLVPVLLKTEDMRPPNMEAVGRRHEHHVGGLGGQPQQPRSLVGDPAAVPFLDEDVRQVSAMTFSPCCQEDETGRHPTALDRLSVSGVSNTDRGRGGGLVHP